MGRVAYETYINQVTGESIALGFGGNYCPDYSTILSSWSRVSIIGGPYANNQLVDVDSISGADTYRFVITSSGQQTASLYYSATAPQLTVGITSTKNGATQGWGFGAAADSWCVATKSGDNVIISCADNTSTSDRTTVVTLVQDESLDVIRIIVQQGSRTPDPDVFVFQFTESPASSVLAVNFTDAASNRTVAMTSTKNGAALGWTISTAPASWCIATKNGNDLAITCAANTAASSRSTSVVLVLDESGITRTINITQAGKTPDVFVFRFTENNATTLTINVPATAGNRSVGVTSTKNGASQNWVVTSGTPAFGTAVKSGTNLAVTWLANENLTSRTFTVTLTLDESGNVITLTVVQAAAEPPEVLDSYYIDVANVTRYFGLDNTPIANLATQGLGPSTITINGIPVVKSSIRSIYFGESYNAITSTPDHLLENCISLNFADFTGFTNVTSIGDSLLRNCGALTSVNLNALTKVTSIGSDFLYNCDGLKSVALTPLSNVTSVGGGFLSGCGSLASINLDPLSKLTEINGNFLSNCFALTSLSLAPLSNVTTVDQHFLAGCTGLTSLDLTSFGNVTSFGDYFLSNCHGLTSLDLTPLNGLTTINSYFLERCYGLTSINLRPLSTVTSIGTYFLSYCEGLTSVDLTPLSRLTSISGYFLSNCTQVAFVDLSAFSGVILIDSGFLHSCIGLTSILIGTVDWHGKSVSQVDLMFGVTNAPTSILYAGSNSLGLVFKETTGNKLSNWEIRS